MFFFVFEKNIFRPLKLYLRLFFVKANHTGKAVNFPQAPPDILDLLITVNVLFTRRCSSCLFEYIHLNRFPTWQVQFVLRLLELAQGRGWNSEPVSS